MKRRRRYTKADVLNALTPEPAVTLKASDFSTAVAKVPDQPSYGLLCVMLGRLARRIEKLEKSDADLKRITDHLEAKEHKLRYALAVMVADPLKPMPVYHERHPKGEAPKVVTQ